MYEDFNEILFHFFKLKAEPFRFCEISAHFSVQKILRIFIYILFYLLSGKIDKFVFFSCLQYFFKAFMHDISQIDRIQITFLRFIEFQIVFAKEIKTAFVKILKTGRPDIQRVKINELFHI